jgi:hypothetical protein
MPNQSPRGNLTAVLLVVALLDLVLERLLGRLFVSHGCTGGLGCAWPRIAPFFLYLTGLLALIVGGGGVVGHLKRGELFPRGVRFTVAGLSLVFWLLVSLWLLFGRMPERYQFMLEASFGFVIALLALSFAGSKAASARTRLGFLLFALPTLLHVAALLSARRHAPLNPERLAAYGEYALLAAAMAAPLLLLPRGVPRARVAAGLAMAAGLGAFFAVAYLARTDLLQTLVLYSVQIELPRAATWLGAAYVIALLGFVTAAGVLLLSPGPARLSGLGICLMGSAGYQTSSPVALSLSMCGLVALSTGTLRIGAAGVGWGGAVAGAGGPDGRLSSTGWRAFLAAVGAAIGAGGSRPTLISRVTPVGGPAEPLHGDSAEQDAGAPPAVPEIEVVPGAEDSAGGNDSDTGVVRTRHRGRAVVVRLSRVDSTVRALAVEVGTPGEGPADTAIEPHELWMSRAPEQRPPHARVKTGDPAFDRVLGVYGPTPVQDRSLRRRLLRLDAGTVSLWRGGAARYVARGAADRPLAAFAIASPAAARGVADIVEVLCDLVDTVEAATPDPEPAPPVA